MNHQQLLQDIIALTDEIAAAIMPIYHNQSQLALKLKDDGSPLTEADLLANKIIFEKLSLLTPDIPILSEESCDIAYAERHHWQKYWLIDPIDGTKEFLAANGEFTVNIALIENHKPILGVVAAPALQQCYYALRNVAAWKRDCDGNVVKIHARQFKAGDVPHIVASRRHGHEAFAVIKESFGDIELVHCGSSLKFCLIAEGKADLYPRLGLTSEWDTAAAQCVLEAAGGVVLDLHAFPLQYNTRDSYQNPYFIAIGDRTTDWLRFFQHDESSTH